MYGLSHSASGSIQIVEIGQDFVVYGNVFSETNDVGGTLLRTNRSFTLLENSMHYFEEGNWKKSENVIEPFPNGAIARRGPTKAIFSPTLDAAAVFDVETQSGKRLRGGVRLIQLFDRSNGRTIELANVKPGAIGQLLPPDRIVFEGCMDGLNVDVVYTWKYNFFAQDIILKERPFLPEEFNAASTSLEIVTEFLAPPVPDIKARNIETDDPDDLVIDFGELAIVAGKAFPINDNNQLALAAWNPSADGQHVRKSWWRTEDERTFLIESVPWSEILPYLDRLAAPADSRIAITPQNSRISPLNTSSNAHQKPIELALHDYKAEGLLLDFVILPNSPLSTTFTADQTYYIPSSYSTGSGVTFEPGSIIKYKQGAYMLLYGAVNFPPSTHQTPVFTSKDDNTFGEVVQFHPDDPNDPDSDGDPSNNKAAKALWIYYVTSNTQVKNARIRWAQAGIRYDQSSGVTATHSISDTLFDNTQTAVELNLPSGSLALAGVKKQNITTQVSGTGSYSGTMSDLKFYTDKSFRGLHYMNAGMLNPPDTMAAVNSSHLIQIVNNYIRVFSKSTGAPLTGEAMTMNTFFGRTGMIDPRITYDASNSRWIACAVGRSPDVLRIAVSKSSNATLAASNWDIHEISLPVFGSAIDWPTLAVDANGVYITLAYFNSSDAITENKIVAIRKSNLYAGSLVYDVKSVTLGELDAITIFPAHNLNSTPVGQFGGYSWFISRLKSSGTGSNYQPGLLAYRRGCWSTITTFSWVDSSWVVLNPTSRPRYFALQDADVHAPTKSAYSAELKKMGSRYMSAIIQGTNLWACHTIGLDGTDGSYGGTWIDG